MNIVKNGTQDQDKTKWREVERSQFGKILMLFPVLTHDMSFFYAAHWQGRALAGEGDRASS